MNGLGRGANYDSQVYLVVIATPLNATRSEDSVQGDTASCSKIGFVNFSLSVPDFHGRTQRKQFINYLRQIVLHTFDAVGPELAATKSALSALSRYPKSIRRRKKRVPSVALKVRMHFPSERGIFARGREGLDSAAAPRTPVPPLIYGCRDAIWFFAVSNPQPKGPPPSHAWVEENS